MVPEPDITVYSPDRIPQMAVEVNASQNTSDEWAREWRGYMQEHELLPPFEYFLMVLPERCYLWKGSANGDAPCAAVPTEELLDSLFGSKRRWRMNDEGLTWAAHSWLSAVVDLPRDEAARRHGWLVCSGLFDRIRGGIVKFAELR